MRYILSALILVFGLLQGCRSEEQIAYDESFEIEEPSYLYVVMQAENDRPKFDYQGYDEEMHEWSIKLPDENGSSPFELVVRRVPFDVLTSGEEDWRASEYNVVNFQGTITRTGKDQFALNATLKTKIPMIIQFVSMIQAGDDSGEEFPEFSFEPGSHNVEFEGTITGWWQEEDEDAEQ